MITVSVPGKVHLMGEHAVVYGYPALFAAVNLRMTVTIEAISIKSKAQNSKVEGKNYEVISSEPSVYIDQIIEVVKNAYKIESLPPFRISIHSDIPPGYHLGSSAATAVGVVAATSYFLKKLWNPVRINEIAYEAEKLQHGTPSGGDNTAVTFGGLLWYRKELEFLKSLWQLPFKPHSNIQQFYLLDTGRPKESTGEMVAMVKLQYTNHKLQIQQLFSTNEEQVRRIAVAIKIGDQESLIDAIRKGERTLEKIGVVSKQVQPIIRAMEKAGGAAKILGGGGKSAGVGFLLCYHRDSQEIIRVAKQVDLKYQPITLGEEGVRLESSR